MAPEYSTIVKSPNKLRILAIITGLFIGLPLCTYLFFSASSFFASASDEIPRDVTITHIDKSSAAIYWTTDRATLSVVEYGLSPNELTLFAPELEAKREHEVELTLLTPGTTYYFQIRNSETTYDNAGVPWTFTTKTSTGEEEAVKGITTRLTPLPTKSPTPTVVNLSTNSCNETDCDKIKAKLGTGCSAKDYVQCIAGKTTVNPSLPLSYHYGTPIPSPTPTSIQIQSNLCKMDYLQSLSNCNKWSWGDSMDVQAINCKKSFYKYVLECKKNDFNTSGGEIGKWAVYSIAQTTYTIDEELLDGVDKVYCRVRAEDQSGNATEWKYNVEPRKCEL